MILACASWACTGAVACGGPGKAAQPTAAEAAPAAAAAPATQAARDDLPKVAFLGDSISAGLHLPEEQAFPSVLRDRLAAEGLRFQLLNAGVSGDTSAGGLRRVDWLLKQSPDIVVVELGANDALRGQPVKEIEQNLRAILEKIRARGATPLLLGMRIPPSFGASYASEFEAIYPRLARELNVAFVPFFMEGVAGVAELNLPDGLHPTREGHERIARKVQEPLAELLQK